MKNISILILVILFFFISKSFAADYICENGKHADGSSETTFFLNLNQDQATTKNKYVSINWKEIPLGYKYKLFKMTNNTSESLLIIAIQKKDTRVLNYSRVSGDPFFERNSVSWGNCSKLGD